VPHGFPRSHGVDAGSRDSVTYVNDTLLYVQKGRHPLPCPRHDERSCKSQVKDISQLTHISPNDRADRRTTTFCMPCMPVPSDGIEQRPLSAVQGVDFVLGTSRLLRRHLGPLALCLVLAYRRGKQKSPSACRWAKRSTRGMAR
jgi:hypothetical protein